MAASQSEERILILPSVASHCSASETQSCLFCYRRLSLTPSVFSTSVVTRASSRVSVNSDIFTTAGDQRELYFFWLASMQLASITQLLHSSVESHRLLDVRLPSDPADSIESVPKGEGVRPGALLRLHLKVMHAHLLGIAIACGRCRCGERSTCLLFLPTIFPSLEAVPGVAVLALVTSLPEDTCHSLRLFPGRRSSC